MGYFNSYSYYNRNQSISYSASIFRLDNKCDNEETENLKDIVNKLMCYYDRLQACSSTSGKKRNYDLFSEVWRNLSNNAKEEAKKYFKFDDNAHLYNDRIVCINKIYKNNFNTTNEASIPKNECGLYFIGQCLVNPHTEEIRYFVKVGKAINFTNRMKSYETHLPMCWHIDFLNVDEDDIFFAEKTYHRALEKISKRLEKKEWFEVSKNQYLTMCELGFNFFE